MEIIKYAGHSCIRCKMLDKMLSSIDIPCDITTKYVEDEGEDKFMSEGVMSLPTLIMKDKDNKFIYSGSISPKQIKEALSKLK